MSKSLVIVESPAKAKTINKYLGKDYTVEASLGHIKDLPKNEIGVELKHRTFEPDLIVIPGKEKVVDRLKKLAAKSESVYLAPDPDREGEAIAAHLAEELSKVVKKNAIHRVTFNEITPKAVRDAFQHARQIDSHLVDAQTTRRVLDRIVGYQVSPLLWDKVRRGLSAGRVQTVAVRLIVEREREIKAFHPVEYWTVDADLEAQSPAPFTARLVGIDGQRVRVETVDAPALPDQKITDEVVAQLKKAAWSVRSVERKERRRNPAAPFTTSKLQQDASRQLGFNVKRTMGVAQRLYEGVDIGGETVGLITYMRTDSTRVAPEAIAAVRNWIKSNLGDNYLPESPNAFKSKKDAQDAHEAIRPTNVDLHPDEIRKYLSDEQYKLYRLIWRRFVASQMTPAVFDQTTVDIVAKADRSYDFRVTGSVLRFDGYLKVYEEAKDKKDEDDEALSNKLPALNEGQPLTLRNLKPEQHYTEPPPRYNEASLVKELEERGIGRPSTYASIINTIQDREYVQKIGGRSGRFVPTEIGTVVNDLLVKNFPYIFDTQYTARLEEELDDIEDGREKWTDLLKAFYGHFEEELKDASKHMENIKRMEKPTDEKCPQCGSPLVLKWGKFGSFYACSSYDKKKKGSCDYTRENFEAKPNLVLNEGQENEQEEEYCENCGRVMVLRNGPWGPFMACPGYNEDPPCKTVRRLHQKQQQKPPEPIDENCPKCGKQLVKRQGQYGEFISCSGYPKCKYIKQNTIGVKCPKCHEGEIVEKKARRGNIFYGCENYPKCDFTANYKPVDQKCPECGSPYLLEKTLKSGAYLVCPNRKATAEEEEGSKKRRRKGEEEPAVTCTFSKRIGDAPGPERPKAETHAPLVEQAV
jgi:DNA topoisomerase-1